MASAITQSKKPLLLHDGDRGAEWGVVPVQPRHLFRHTNAAVAVRHSRQKALMHADSARDPHEERHWCPSKVCARRTRILLHVHIFGDDISGGIHIVAIKI